MDGNGRVLACCEVHHTREEKQLREFKEHSGARRGDGGVQDSVAQEGDSNGQTSDSGIWRGEGSDPGGNRNSRGEVLV